MVEPTHPPFDAAMKRHLVMALAAWFPLAAQAADKDPTDYSIRQYGVMLGVALLGGLVSWINKVRAGQLPAWSLMQLVGELATSAFSGLLCFWICEWTNTPQLLTISLVAIAGHMGTRAIILFERWAERRYGLRLPDDHIDTGGEDAKATDRPQ